MKFKVGSRVEVLRRNEEPCGSWFPAKILSKDGNKYTVRFELFLTVEGEPVLETAPEEYIRPFPPLVSGKKRWVVGDIVEVFDLHSWRAGKVVKVLRNNYFVIRLYGSIQHKEFQISSLRVRQAWHNNHWVMIGQLSEEKQLDYGNTNSSSRYKIHMGYGAQGGSHEEACSRERNEWVPVGKFFPARTVKKNNNSQCNSFPDYAVRITGKKRKAASEVGNCHQLTKRSRPKKVDAISFPEDKAGEECILTSTKERTPKFSMDLGKLKTKDHTMHSLSLQVIEENNECSVASCSGNSLTEYSVHGTRKSSREMGHSFSDDAKSLSPSKSEKRRSCISEDELAAYVHELELHAYQSTMRALYASGPLSWELESLLTNLRLFLHISIEEHLLQLRHLLSA